MTYVDLGRYTFTTGKDYTGQNDGKLTSILDLSPIQVPYFEMYRLLISTASVPGSLPAVVQTTSAQNYVSLVTLTFAFPAATTVGNTIVVCTGSNATGTSPTQNSATIGGIADHFGNVAGATSNNGAQNASFWVCPQTTQTSTAVVAGFTGGAGSSALLGVAYELSNMLATTTAASAVDQTGTATSGGANVTSETTPTKATTAANELMVGFATQFNPTANPSMSTGTTTPSLTNLPQVSGSPAGGIYFSALSSYGNVALTGTNVSYNAITTQPGNLTAVMASLFPAVGAGTAIALPFTVAVDGKIWDNATTTPGVGYTYNMQQPLALNEGNTLQIFWTSLLASQYLSYAGQFNIQAWFRYDPSIQRRS